MLTMKRTWLLFTQTVTILLAVYFVVATLKPQWLDRKPRLSSVVPVLESPAGSATDVGAAGMPSFRKAAQVASAAVVSISTSKAPQRNPNQTDPWFQIGRASCRERV